MVLDDLFKVKALLDPRVAEFVLDQHVKFFISICVASLECYLLTVPSTLWPYRVEDTVCALLHNQSLRCGHVATRVLQDRGCRLASPREAPS